MHSVEISLNFFSSWNIKVLPVKWMVVDNDNLSFLSLRFCDKQRRYATVSQPAQWRYTPLRPASSKKTIIDRRQTKSGRNFRSFRRYTFRNEQSGRRRYRHAHGGLDADRVQSAIIRNGFSRSILGATLRPSAKTTAAAKSQIALQPAECNQALRTSWLTGRTVGRTTLLYVHTRARARARVCGAHVRVW